MQEEFRLINLCSFSKNFAEYLAQLPSLVNIYNLKEIYRYILSYHFVGYGSIDEVIKALKKKEVDGKRTSIIFNSNSFSIAFNFSVMVFLLYYITQQII